MIDFLYDIDGNFLDVAVREPEIMEDVISWEEA